MPYEWISTSLGGGLLGLFGVIIAVLAGIIYLDLKGQVRELKSDNREMRATLTRLADVVESWMPEHQQRRVKRP